MSRLERWFLAGWYGQQHESAAGRVLWQIARPVLAALAWITGLVSRRRAAQITKYSHANAHPRGTPAIIVVGNLVAGGSGKTPIVIALVQALQTHPQFAGAVGVVARGYKAGPPQADGLASAGIQGDEARLVALRCNCPVQTDPNRSLALQSLMHQAPHLRVVIADDGLQHVGLARDLELVVIDPRGFGNRRLLPAGPLRESTERLNSVDGIILSQAGSDHPLALGLPTGVPVFRCSTQVIGFRCLSAPEQLVSVEQFRVLSQAKHLAALAGIATPEAFFTQLRTVLAGNHARLNRDDCLALPDHSAIAATLPAHWLNRCGAELLLVTEKDLVKCRADWQGAASVWAMVIEAQLPDQLVHFVINQTLQLLKEATDGPTPA